MQARKPPLTQKSKLGGALIVRRSASQEISAKATESPNWNVLNVPQKELTPGPAQPREAVVTERESK